MATENVRTSTGRHFFVNQNFAMIWIGGTIARLSEGFLFTAFGLWIINFIAKDQSSAATAVKGITMVAMIALFVLGPVAGVFVDRWKNQKRVLLITSVLRSGIALLPILGSLFLSLTTTHAPWMTVLSLGSIYLATFAISILTHFSIPISYVLFADCVEEQDYSYANGVLLVTSFLGAMFGPPLALLLFSVVGFPGALLFDAGLYMITFFATTRIHIEAREHIVPQTSFFRGFWEGIVICLKNSLLRMLLISLVLINVWNGALSMLGGSFIMKNLHANYEAAPIYVPQGFYGTVGITIGVAFTVGALLFGLISRRIGEKRVLSYSLLLIGVLALVFSRFTLFIPALATIFVISLLTMGVNVPAVPLYLWVTPRHFLGRVRAAVDVLTNLTAVVVGGVCLWLVNSVLPDFHVQFSGMTFTPVDSVFTVVGVICMVGGIVIVRASSRTRKAGLNDTEMIPTLSQSAESSESFIETIPEPSAPRKF